MHPNDHATQVMLPTFLEWMPKHPEFVAGWIKQYFEMCPWAKPLIDAQLREAWRSLSPSASSA